MQRSTLALSFALIAACAGPSAPITVDGASSTDSGQLADIGSPADTARPSDASAAGTRLGRLSAADDWAYLIEGPDLSALAAAAYDVVVIDYAADGAEDTAFSRAQIEALRASGEGKLVIAYMSLGEAEDYRFYWGLSAGQPGADWQGSPPAWLGPTNPDWPGNYKVRYWDPEWQAVIVHNPGGSAVLGDAPSYLDRVLAAGFDGVFLDIVDGFEYWGPTDEGGTGERGEAAGDMAELLATLAAYARSVDPGFIVCQQNGAALLSSDLSAPLSAAQRAGLLGAVDWISVEDVFYRGAADANNGLDPDTYRISLIDAYRDAGKKVTVIDYFDPTEAGYEAAEVDDFFSRARARGWVPTSGPRALDRLISYPGHAPD